jgi:hypothetical protein
MHQHIRTIIFANDNEAFTLHSAKVGQAFFIRNNIVIQIHASTVCYPPNKTCYIAANMVRILAPALVLMIWTVSFPGIRSLSQQCSPNNKLNRNQISRRRAIFDSIAASFAVATIGIDSLLTSPANAAGTIPPTPEELKRIQIGYQQITDFLNNFEQATTTCRENGGECKRDAEPIRE